MAQLIQCDKCKKVTEDKSVIRKTKLIRDYPDMGEITITKDICDDCYEPIAECYNSVLSK